MQRLLAVIIAVQLLAGSAAMIIDELPRRTRVVPVNETRLRPNQMEVTGTVTLLRADTAFPDAPLALPITISPGRATISNALVDGRPSAIAWDGGRPFVLHGDGTVDVGGALVEVDAGGVRWHLDGTPRAITPGGYRVNTPVAVGISGLARPRNAVQFVADDKTAIATSGGARIDRPLAPLTLEGSGRLHLEGQLWVRLPTTSRAGPAPLLTSHGGTYRVTITPKVEGLQITVLLQQD